MLWYIGRVRGIERRCELLLCFESGFESGEEFGLMIGTGNHGNSAVRDWDNGLSRIVSR